MHQLRRALSLLVVALMVISAPAVSPAQQNELPRSEISALLNARAKALNDRDRNGFLATVDKSSAGFYEGQARYFDQSGNLPLVDHEIRLDPDEADEFTRAKDRSKYGDPALVAAVDHRYKLKAYDVRPNLKDLSFTFVRRAGSWLIAGDEDLEDLGEISDKEPWELGPVRTKESAHFMLIYHPDEAAYADELLAAAENAIRLVDRVWQLPWNRKIPIQVPSTEKELSRLLEATYEVGGFIAFAVSAVDRQNEDAWALVGHRIILNRENFLRYSDPVRTSLLAHEILHVATREISGPFVPAFLDEGIAQLAESDTPVAFDLPAQTRGSDGKLPESWEFFSGGQTEILKAYRESESALLFFQSRFGIERLNALYEALGKVRVAPGTERFQIDQSFRSTVGMGFDDFERQWALAIKAR